MSRVLELLLKTQIHCYMGAGIGGVIPLVFHFEKDWWKRRNSQEKTKKDFVDFYDEIVAKDDIYYCIKSTILLNNFKDFYFRFHLLIEAEEIEESMKIFKTKYDEIVAANDLDAFITLFSENYGYGPRVMDGCFFAPAENMICDKVLTFYNGSYKAILEEYSTLHHMRKLLAKALDNPLVQITCFGILG
jgi:hypothetical protein